MERVIRVSGLMALLIASALTAQGSSTPCRRPPAKSHPAGEVLVISGLVKAPCKIELRDLGIELKHDGDKIPDLVGWSAVQDSRGRYYTSNGFGEITVWNPDGTFMRNVGREGSGPGEFMKGIVYLRLDPADNLYAFDGHQQWAVFSPDYKFLKMVRGREANIIGSMASFPYAPMMFLSTESSSRDMMSDIGLESRDTTATSWFTVFDFNKEATSASGSFGIAEFRLPVARRFGTLTSDEKARSIENRTRMISPPVGDAFWAGPPAATGRGYELQLWNVNGTLKRTIRRDVPWFKPGSDLAPVYAPSPVRGRPPVAPRSKPLSRISMMRDDGTGLIYLLVRVINDEWDQSLNEAPSSPKRDSMIARASDYYYEVIDAEAGVVLASEGPFRRTRALEIWPSSWIGKGWRTVWLHETEKDGLIGLRMKEFRLVGNP